MRIPFRGLGQIGLISDAPPYDLPVAALTRAENVDLNDKAIRKSPGWTKAFDTPNAVWMESWFAQAGSNLIYIDEGGANPVIQSLNISGTFDDITNGIVFTSGLQWDTTGFGESVVLTNGTEQPYYSNAGAGIQLLPGWDATWRADIIRPYQNFLVALRVAKGGVFNANQIQWSNLADNNIIPGDWDETDPASLAAGGQVNGDNGPIIDGRALDKSFIIYQPTGCSAMSFVGGQYVMNIRPLHNRGLLSRDAVTEFDKKHFCIGQGVIYINTGAGVVHMAEDKVQTKFFNDLVSTDGLSVFHDPQNRRILTFYKDDPNTAGPNRVLKWDYSEDAWTFDDLGTKNVVRAKYGPTATRGVTWDSIDVGGSDPDAGASWSDINTQWVKLDSQLGDIKLQLLIDNNGAEEIVAYEDVNTRGGDQFDTLVEREYIDFDELMRELPLKTEHIKHVKSILPQAQGDGILYFQFGFAKAPNLPTVWGKEVTYDLQTDYKIDFRETGRYFAWRMRTKTDAAVNFKLSGFDIEVELAGER